MSKHSTQFEATTGGMVLTNAILLYRTEATRSTRYGAPAQDGRAFASLHHIEHDDDAGPRIAAGTPLTRAHLRQWAEALGRAAAPELLPANVLVAHQDLLAWWIPAKVRPAYFDLSAPSAGLKTLGARTVVPVPYPAHLLVATRRALGVYALQDDERPTADTTVFHSPILNVYADGTLCWGNIPRPGSLAVSAIPDFERALFESWSTHPNHGQDQTVAGKGGLTALWDDLAARRATRFPVKRLKAFAVNRRSTAPLSKKALEPLTLGRLIEGTRR
ncbi:PRTRC system protein B [Sphingobium yanoikuyae]|uniref:PRTRC system protein B n=1 Tax=Sphingobium yanoikuyae TaxID=13690 RepID=UPI000262C594|nr:PRTRC system protein B [Sphingobium yanoikuyae]